MGLWALGTHRKLVAREMRLEVTFETPWLFVTSPDNKKGPVQLRAIHYIDGTDQSYINARMLHPVEQDQADPRSYCPRTFCRRRQNFLDSTTLGFAKVRRGFPQLG
jgi:hypothetical protein